ncbi:CocE/NonD family hydrolase [Sphingomonas lutea]|uniref:CocE/NonD family hydrolase n=1 Tax=Sphingomonas lutea TaxID=1045317 RepID=A0A7G9SJF1_9SPHN|nr:CocE/NonD family hydrolase [Sphingomonas lutea]QNN67976.1 CocE/NonD family hydrolase [Sphingomonas lutea]
MIFRKISLTAALALAAPLVAPAQENLQPAVQPGGDIPRVSPRPPARPPQQRIVQPAPAPTQYARREATIAMRDGARLYTVLILPRNAANAPILLERTPYSAAKSTARGVGPWPENILTPAYAELVRAGFIVAIQDVRGKHRSEGDYVMNRPLRGPLNPTPVDHSTDAWDSIDWLVKNVPESNRKVATIGASYEGFTALMSLIDPHPALRAAVPINPMVDVWKGDDWFHNGAFRQEMVAYVYSQTAARTSDDSWFPGSKDNYATALRYGSASEYARAMGVDRLPFWRRLTRHPNYDHHWQAQALDRMFARRPPTVPMLLVGGLWDQEDIYGTPALFDAVKRVDGGRTRFVLGPWHHGQVVFPALSLGPLHWGSDTARWFRQTLLLPFLKQHLKDGPPADIARVTAFEAGTNQWRRFDDWPQACAAGCPTGLTPLHLAGERALDFDAPRAAGSDSYVSDPADPVPYRARPNLSPWAPGSTWRLWLVDDQRFASARQDVLTYTSAPLTAPLKLAGTPLANLVASTTGSDSDWVVKLIDVYPASYPRNPGMAGYQLPIAMEVMRGRFRDDPAQPTRIPPRVPVTYRFALPTVNYVVQPGHRLMVQIQSSWFPLYDRNPQSFVPNIFFAQSDDYQRATQRVFFGPGGTWIGLPIVR